MAAVTMRSIVAKEELVCDNGMVVAKHPLAAQAGLDVLMSGGNAIDAAVATAFAAGVTLPLSNGIGGGGYLIYHRAGGPTTAIDYHVRAPAAAQPEMYELVEGPPSASFGWHAVKDNANWDGWLSMAVPGTVAGLCHAQSRFGTMDLPRLIAPALRLAEEGFPLDYAGALQLAQALALTRRFPSTAAILSNDGVPIKTGEILRQASLAATLKAIARGGPTVFYQGEIAEAIAQDMQENGGLLTADDLAGYAARELDGGLATGYRGYTIVTSPTLSGGPTLLESLNILDGFPLGALGLNTTDSLHRMIEAFRQAFADRFQYLADPEQVEVPLSGLLSREYAAEQRGWIAHERARYRSRAGNPWAYEGRPRPAEILPASRPWATGGTTHLCVVDRDRNVVSLTQTLLSWSGVALPRTGIIMNDGMGWFDPEPGHPNSVGPGKRPVSNMAPVLILKDGRPYLTLGSPGGRRIINTNAQVLMGLIDHGLGVQDAVAAPKIDCSMPTTSVDVRIPESVRAALARMGHQITPVVDALGSRQFASPSAILIHPETGRLHGGEDPIGVGVAMGY